MSPYLRAAQDRIDAADAAKRWNALGANADIRPEHYTFARQQRLYTPPLAKSRPQESWLAIIVCGLMGVAGMAALWLSLLAFADYFSSTGGAL